MQLALSSSRWQPFSTFSKEIRVQRCCRSIIRPFQARQPKWCNVTEDTLVSLRAFISHVSWGFDRVHIFVNQLLHRHSGLTPDTRDHQQIETYYKIYDELFPSLHTVIHKAVIGSILLICHKQITRIPHLHIYFYPFLSLLFPH